MKKNKLIFLFSILILAVIFVYSFQGGESDSAYIERIEKEREDKDRFMRTSEESPFVGNTENYKGLEFFAPNPTYKVNARFEKTEEGQRLTLPTSDGKSRDYLEYGYASFELNGKENRLLVLEDVSNDEEGLKLFLAFGDATSTISTYGGGRYLDLKHSGGRNILIDFNQAYNPYCAYSETFSCPLPPRENLLGISIEAGEKNY